MCLDVNDADNEGDDYQEDSDDNHNDDNRCVCALKHNIKILQSSAVASLNQLTQRAEIFPEFF